MSLALVDALRGISVTKPRNTHRRTVLKTAGGVLAGTTILTGSGAAQNSEVSLNIRQETIQLKKNGVVPTRVTVPEELAHPEYFPGLVYLGLAQNAELVGGGSIYSIDNLEEFAQPASVQEVSGDEWVMTFATEDIDFRDQTGNLEMGVAVPGDGWRESDVAGDRGVPPTNWATDNVRIINGII